MRQEIVSDEEAKEHEVINEALKVERKGQLQFLKLEIEVLSHHGYLDVLEFSSSSQSNLLACNLTCVFLFLLSVIRSLYALSKDVKVRFVSSKTKHD